MENWVDVFSTVEEFEAERLKELLISADIPAVVLNKKDTAYPSLGDIQVMVAPENREKAEEIIRNEQV